MKNKWAYLAGLLDGDGCIFMSYRNRKRGFEKTILASIEPRISIITADAKFASQIKTLIGGKTYCHNANPKAVGKYISKKSYSVNIYDRTKQIKFLKEITPYLVLKKKHALLMLFYLLNRIPGTPTTSNEIKIAKKMHNLNGGDSKRKMRWL